jgi:hypothetical protein
VHACEMHHNLKLLDAALLEQNDWRFLFKNFVCSRVSHNFMLQKVETVLGRVNYKLLANI